MRPWWFSLEVDWDSGNVVNGKKVYACKDGVLIIHEDQRTVQYKRNSWYDEDQLTLTFG